MSLYYNVFEAILNNNNGFIIPSSESEDMEAKIKFIVNNFDILVSDREINDLKERYIIPQKIREIMICDTGRYPEISCFLKNEKHLSKKEFSSYFFPDELKKALLSCEFDHFIVAFRYFQQLKSRNMIITLDEYDSVASDEHQSQKYLKPLKSIITYPGVFTAIKNIKSNFSSGTGGYGLELI